MTRLTQRFRDDSEKGSIVTATAIAIPVLILAVGLVLDGGRQMGAYSYARDLADNAARAGAQQVEVDGFRVSGTAVLNVNEARIAAQNYLASQGHSGVVTVNGNSVTVTVTIESQRVLLPGKIVVQGNETAEARSGVGGQS